MLGILDHNEIEDVLQNHILGRIGCHADNTTYIVPVSYAYDGGSVYVHTHEGKKIDMMRKNPEVCFEVENFSNMGNWSTVIAWGTFEEIKDEKERKHALTILLQRPAQAITSKTMKLHPHWPFEPEDINAIGGIVFRIRLREKTGRFESHLQGKSAASPYL